MVIHVTKKINMDAIALTDWVLEQYYPNSKQLDAPYFTFLIM